MTVSSEYSSRDLPTNSSFLRMSAVTVMMWQPMSSAWKMLRSSLGLARISSADGASRKIRERFGHQRHWIATGVRNPTGEYRHTAWRAAFE